MNSIFFLFVFASIFINQVRCDELDDLRQKYLDQLKVISDSSDQLLDNAQSNLDETDLYMSHAFTSFTNDGANKIILRQEEVNTTAADLTLQAIMNNKPTSVLTCLSTQREKGTSNLDALFGPFQNSLTNILTASSANFNQQRATLELIQSQLTGLYESNAAKLETCVVDACFENDLAEATVQYDNLNKSVNTISTTVKEARASFNNDVFKQVDNLRDKMQSAVDAAVKALKKC